MLQSKAKIAEITELLYIFDLLLLGATHTC